MEIAFWHLEMAAALPIRVLRRRLVSNPLACLFANRDTGFPVRMHRARGVRWLAVILYAALHVGGSAAHFVPWLGLHSHAEGPAQTGSCCHCEHASATPGGATSAPAAAAARNQVGTPCGAVGEPSLAVSTAHHCGETCLFCSHFSLAQFAPTPAGFDLAAGLPGERPELSAAAVDLSVVSAFLPRGPPVALGS